MEERRGEWAGYYPYVLIAMVIAVAFGAGLSTYVRETTGSWLAFLIMPVVAEVLVAILLLNRRRFDVRPIYDPASDAARDGTYRCLWCGTPGTGEYCSPACEEHYRRADGRADRFAFLFLVAMVPITIMAAVGYRSNVLLGGALLLIGYGALFIALPEVVAGTAAGSGMKVSMWTSRIAGLIFLTIGCVMLLFANQS